MATLEEIKHLDNLCAEADWLLFKNDSQHNMHGFRAAIYDTKHCLEKGIYKENSYDGMTNCDYLIRCMRNCDIYKQFPKKGVIEKRNIKSWLEVGV